jgi:hypothetical protein
MTRSLRPSITNGQLAFKIPSFCNAERKNSGVSSSVPVRLTARLLLC